jgi:hypothetical protein
MMRSERRGPWYLLTGLILGVALGLVYAWLISPVAYVDNPPVSLRTDYKDQYRVLIALAYAANGDLGRARVRLALLGDADPGGMSANQAARFAAENRPLSEVQALVLLAEALGSTVELFPSTPSPTPTLSPSKTPASTPSPAATVTVLSEIVPTSAASNTDLPVSTGTGLPPDFTPIPTRTPTITIGAPYVLTDRELICDPVLPGPLLQVFVSNAAGDPVPGIPIQVIWEAGQERFFTGLKPEIGPGYADFDLQPQINYTLQVGDGGQMITDLLAAECDSASGSYWGSWRLTFVQP